MESFSSTLSPSLLFLSRSSPPQLSFFHPQPNSQNFLRRNHSLKSSFSSFSPPKPIPRNHSLKSNSQKPIPRNHSKPNSQKPIPGIHSLQSSFSSFSHPESNSQKPIPGNHSKPISQKPIPGIHSLQSSFSSFSHPESNSQKPIPGNHSLQSSFSSFSHPESNSQKPIPGIHSKPNSQNPIPRNHSIESAFSSFLKSACIALIAGAAFFFASLHKPPIAFAINQIPQKTENFDLETLSEEEKVKILEGFLDSNPDDIQTLRSLMEIKIAGQNIPEAISIINRLITLENDQKDLPLLKAHLQIYQGEAEKAKLEFESMLEKDPIFVEAYHGLVMAAWNSETVGDLKGVLDRIEAAMEICKKDGKFDCLRDFQLLVAQVKIVEGKYEEALKVYDDLVKEEPRDFRPYLCQGIVYSMLRKNDEAEKQFQKYRELVPKEHPYSQYFDENMIAMKVFSQIEENKRASKLSG